jgi:NADP-dependent 3-hydroxy acid dehydrogenase YdfG
MGFIFVLRARPGRSGDKIMGQQDRIWFITGASSGFGRALAEAVIARGERVVAVARRREALAELASLAPDRVLVLPLDVTDPQARAEAVATAVAHFGRIDILANIARRVKLGSV